MSVDWMVIGFNPAAMATAPSNGISVVSMFSLRTFYGVKERPMIGKFYMKSVFHCSLKKTKVNLQ